MSLAIAVRIAGSSVRSSARRGQRRARRSATTSIASVADPPLPSASTCRRRRARARSAGGGRASTSRPSRSASARAARRPRSPWPAPSARTSASTRLEVVSALAQERIEEARTRRCRGAPPRGPRAGRGARRRRARAPRARGRASRPAPGATNGSRVGGRELHSPDAPNAIVRQPRPRRRDAAGLAAILAGPNAIAMSSARRAAPRVRSASPQPERRQRALADDHRVDELDGDVARVRPRGRDAPSASSRPPRAKRSAIRWHSAPAARPRREEALAGAPRRAPETEPSAGDAPLTRRRPAAAARATRATPSTPRRSARSPACARRPDAPRRGGEEACRCRSPRAASRSILLMSTSSHARNMSGYFSGLSSPSVTETPSPAHPRRCGTRRGRPGCRRSR